MRVPPAVRVLVALAAALVVPACGGGSSGGGIAGINYTAPSAFAVPLAAGGPDQLMSACAGPAGSFYAAGYAAQTPGGPKFVVVVKILANGTLDPGFGVGGVATTAVEFAGGTDEIDVAVQPVSGNIVVSATIANNVDALDRDVCVFRMSATGVFDAAFAPGGANPPVAGALRLDLSTAPVIVPVPPATAVREAPDLARGLAIDATDRIYLHARAHATGNLPGTATPRTDSEFVVLRLSDTGVLDTAGFGTGGLHVLDLGFSNATPRALAVLTDGTIVAGGYANSGVTGWTSTTQPVIYKLTSAGVLVAAFAAKGVYHQTVWAVQTEVYNFAVHGNTLVTGGYGRNSGANNLWVSLRLDATTGVRDPDWGGAVNGAVAVDPSGGLSANNCHNAVALPGGKTLLVGATGVAAANTQNAAFAVLDANGFLDGSYGSRAHVLALDPFFNDQFWGGAVNGNTAIVVGFQGAYPAQTVGQNDNSCAVLIPLQ